MKKSTPEIIAHFKELEDPRVEGKNRHLLIDILVLAISGVIRGATDWEQIEIFGKAKQEWFETFLELPNGIPSQDTFRRVLSRICAKQFQECFGSGSNPLPKQRKERLSL